MKISVLMCVLTFSVSVFSQSHGPGNSADKKCVYECGIYTIKENSEKHLLVAPLLNGKFKAIGGYTTDMNTSCMFNGEVEGVKLKALISDSFGYSTQLLLIADEASMSSEGSGIKGKYSVTNGKFGLECYRD